jgi:biopolymer transport protein ExbD
MSKTKTPTAIPKEKRSFKNPWKRRRMTLSPEINVTPLVDVVLVLLIIFMVVAPQMENDVPVDLPGIYNPDPEGAATDPLKVSIPRANEYYISNQKYNLEGAVIALETAHTSNPSRRVILRADAQLKYGDMREILARIQKIGFPGVSLMVGERNKETS